MPADKKKWHFGVLSFTGTGHLNPLIALSQELKDRGHKVTFFEKPKIEARIRQAGLEFIPIGATADSTRITPPTTDSGLLSELSMLHFNLARVIRDIESYLRDTPTALSQAGVDAMLINEIALTGPTVAQLLGLPYFIISTTVPHHWGWKGPSWRTGYRYSASCLSWIQRALLEVSVLRMRGPIRRALEKYRSSAGLGKLRQASASFPALAHLTQLPKCLDLPRRAVPTNFYYTAPWASNAARPRTAFPWDRLDGRPVIYASLGTTRNAEAAVLRLIAEACVGLDVQLVISLGGRFDPVDFADLPGRPLVVRFAPQLELLKIARIVISHGGPNTAFEALMAGKPMIVIPMAYDQPAIAARLARLHIAKVLPIMRLSAARIRTAVTNLLGDTSYERAAFEMQAKLLDLRGSVEASGIIEDSLEQYLDCQRINTSAELPDSAYDNLANCATVSRVSETRDSRVSIAASKSSYSSS
jgi:zeaxanthin glucosyltransferase